MEFDQYVVARRGRLVEHAVGLGCAADEAPALVDEVLQARRRAITRAEDPDPEVFAALDRTLTGSSGAPARPGLLAALGALALAGAVAGVVTDPPDAATMPSLFALHGSDARTLLEGHGYDVVLLPTPACAPEGLVVATYPRPGQPVAPGASVTVRTAVSRHGTTCTGDEGARADAWAFVAFVLGGEPPPFADTVSVVLDQGRTQTIRHDQALDPGAWGPALEVVARTARQVAGTDTGLPVLRAAATVPPDTSCGVPRPPTGGSRSALRIQIDPRGPHDDHGCPLTVDLYRVGPVIDAVVVYSPRHLGTR